MENCAFIKTNFMNLLGYKKKALLDRRAKSVSDKIGKEHKPVFVVQRHDAAMLHYDLRIEIGGVLKCWAIPKGPSLNVHERRLAIMVEDQPVSYASFKGTVPAGHYESGLVEIWDKGTFAPAGLMLSDKRDKALLKQIREGNLKIVLSGKKLKGTFRLLRIREKGDNLWLLIKGNDSFAVDHPYDSEDYRQSA